MTSIRKRVLVILGVLTLAIWSIYPPADRIKLGLDLNGGVQLVLRVDTDDALWAQTRAAAGQLRDALTKKNVPFTKVEATGPTEFTAWGVREDAALRDASRSSEVTFERRSQPDGSLFRMRPRVVAQLRDDTVQQARETIERRVNALGVAEPVVARYTEQDQIFVQLPGVSDVEGAKRLIRSTAQLRLTLVERGPFASQEAAVQAYDQRLPGDLEVLPGRAHEGAGDETVFYVIRRAAAVTGNDLRNARAARDEYNRPAVAFTLKPEAARRFGTFTEQNAGRRLATVLDERVTSVATIISRIDDEGQIVGISREEMMQQVIILKAGALPADLEYVAESTVGASLGKDSVRGGVLASIGGLALVGLFMAVYYKRTGINALVSILVNLLILLGLVAYIPVTMTLPGIAGLILTIGMGVDSNVLIFERIKEELAAERTTRAAVNAAFKRVWITIVDTHVASLIAAAFLYQFGTDPIRGFATTLTLGLLANVLTAVFVSKTLFMLSLRGTVSKPLSIRWDTPSKTTRHINFARWRWHAIAASLLVMTLGVATMMTRGLALGIDFSGGTLIVVEFRQPGVTEQVVRNAVATLPGEEIVQQYGSAEERRFQIRSPLLPESGSADPLERQVRQVAGALEGAGLPEFAAVSRHLVTAVIGDDLQRRGIYATVTSVVGITAYIALRFRYSFALGAIAATLHDMLVTVACLAFAGYDLSLNVTAALLTITGYSVNDTIVVFDRVRENLRTMSGDSLERVVDASVSQTLSRTIITAGTTLLAALSLFLFGGEPLEGFAFTMLVGIASGTYSTVFIASAMAVVLSRQKRGARPPSPATRLAPTAR